MQEINFSALGGIGENGKNFYLLKIKSSYFILDAGLKYPNVSIHGIDFIISEYTRLESIKKQIQGIFITSVLETHSGAFPYLMKYLQDVPVYASFFAIEVLKTMLEQHNIDCNKVLFKIVNENTQIDFPDTKISFFNISHFLPETFGLAFDTLQGFVIYISEIHFLQSKNKKFQTNFFYLSKLVQKKILAFITASQGAFNIVKNSKDELLEYNLSSYFSKIENNIFLSFLIPDLLKIQLVINLAIEFNLKVAILGRKSERIIDVALRQNYLKIPSGFFVNFKTSNDYLKYKNLVVIIVGKRFESLYRLQRMCKKTDRLMQLKPKDKILLLSVEKTGIDKVQSKTLDLLARNGFLVDILVKDLLNSSYNYEENFKLILYLLEPKFLIPVIGEYRHQYQIKKISKNLNYLEDRVFMLENGDNWIYDFKNKPIIRKNFFKNLSEILIDGTPILEGNDYILKDRELLGNDGVIIVVCSVDSKLKKIISNVELISKGFLDKNKIQPILSKLKDLFICISKEYLNNNKQIQWYDFKNNLKNDMTKFVFKETKKRPVIIPVLIMTNHL